MRLDEMMRDAVAPATVDAHDVAQVARRRGTTERRRRRLATVVGGVGAVAAVCLGVALVLPTGTGGPDDDVASDPAVSGTTTLDGRSTVAAMRALVDEVADGEFGGYAGQGPGGGAPDTYGELQLSPPGEGTGVIGVNVQGRELLRAVSGRCEAYMRDCSVRELPNGDLLRLYSDPAVSTDNGDGLRRVAEVLSESRGLRVVVAATNGLDLPSNRWDVTRPEPVLTDEQLSAVATDDLWAFRVPSDYANQGAELAPYQDLDAVQELQPTPAPEAPESRSTASPDPTSS